MSLRSNYERNGYVIVRNRVDSEVIGLAEQHVRRTMAEYPDLSAEELHRKTLWLEDPFYLYLARQPGLVELATELVGPDLAVFATGYIIKEPGNSPAVLWHQDGSYWPLDPMEVCTIWLAITDSTPENGCMRVIPGSHTLSLQELRKREDVRNLLDSEIDSALVDEERAADLVLSPGDASVHHPNIVHGSAANDSEDQWRLNLVIRIIAATTRVTDPEWPGVFHLSGRELPEVNTYLPDPAWAPEKHIAFPGAASE